MVNISYDKDADVLYVKIKDKQISTGTETKECNYIIINKDNNQEITGLQLISVSDISKFFLIRVLLKNNVPYCIIKAVDEWSAK